MASGQHPILEKQGWHLVSLIVLLAAAFAAARLPNMQIGTLWGCKSQTWLWIAIAVPAIHQVYVALGWRTQLASQWLTQRFPIHGFNIWVATFMVLLLARPVTVTLLAIANRDTFTLTPTLRWILVTAVGIPLIWLVVSIARYFGIARATGADNRSMCPRASGSEPESAPRIGARAV